MKKSIRTAIVGSLQALNVHLPAFQASPEFRVTAICCRNTERRQRFSAPLPEVKSYTDWHELIDAPEIDLVALALPAAVQSEAALRLTQAGKHLFCEKPLATTLADAQKICDSAQQHHTVAGINFGFRMVEAFRDFQSVVASGILGRPQLLKVEWLLSSRRNPAFTWNWKSDANQGGGTLNLMGSHTLDYLRWIFGEIHSLNLQATALVGHRPDAVNGQPRKVESDDTCNLLLRVASGPLASVSISTALPTAGSHRIRAWFDKGLLELAQSPGDDYFDGFKLTFQPAQGCEAVQNEVAARSVLSKMAAVFPGKIVLTQRMISQIALAIDGQKNLLPTLGDAVKVQELLETAHAQRIAAQI